MKSTLNIPAVVIIAVLVAAFSAATPALARSYRTAGTKAITFTIEQHSRGEWRPLTAELEDTWRENHDELENVLESFGAKALQLDDTAFRSAAYRIRPSIGKKYRVKMVNETDCRIAVTLAVDGLNSVDSKDVKRRGGDVAWVLSPDDETVIPGFQSGMSQAKEFFWTTPESAHSDRVSEIGAIEMHVYYEDTPCVREQFDIDNYYIEEGAAETRSLGKGAEMGTGAGNEVDNPIIGVTFRRLTDQPVEIVRVVYSDGVSTRAPRLYSGRTAWPDWDKPEKSECFTGIGVRLDTGEDGAVVDEVFFSTPAWWAHLQKGDRITAVNGVRVRSPRDVRRVMSELEPGDYAAIKYIRYSSEREETIELETICPDEW